MNDIVYIYNVFQKNFYRDNGIRMIDSDVNPNTGKQWWSFSKKETEEVYSKWCKKCHKNNNEKRGCQNVPIQDTS